MKRSTVLISIAMLVIASGLGVASSAVASPDEPDSVRARDWERHCGSQRDLGAGWYNVRADNTKCTTARHVARYYWNSGFDKHFEGWDCRNEQTGYETYRADCKRSNHGRRQHVRFAYGA